MITGICTVIVVGLLMYVLFDKKDEYTETDEDPDDGM